MNNVYQGPSDGFADLVEGYIDYSEEIIATRATPDLRDGQKKVSRRILYAMYLNHKDYLQKSATMVGKAMEYHPHGDASIYGTMTLMTDENGSYNVPPLIGDGNLGKVFLSDKPAHMRYTKVRLNPSTVADFFSDMEVTNMVLSEEGYDNEPEVLDVSYPVVLVNGASGIAVSAGTKMASYNFGDVLQLTKKYLQQGKLEVNDIIYPDFPTGGIMVCNKEEVARMMLTGGGKVKIRARVDIEGSSIIVKEVPFGKTAGYIVDKIKASNIPGVSNAMVSVGRNAETGIVTVECKSKRVVEEVLMHLYQKNILQSSFSSNILVVNAGKPELLGVHGIIERWCEWRISKVSLKIKNAIAAIERDMATYSVFIRLIDNAELRDKFVDIVTHQGKSAASNFLLENLEGCDVEAAKWILDRSIGVFHNGGTYREKYNKYAEDLIHWKNYDKDPKQYIIDQLDALYRERNHLYPRKTELTFKDYRFSKVVDADEIEDDSFCVYTLKKDGFLVKSRSEMSGDNVLYNIPAQANSILIGFDNYGRLLRVIGKEIPYTPANSQGTYLPKYFACENEVEEFNYKILYLCVLDGSKKMLVYRDGYIGFFDTSEYLGKKNIKVVNQGVCVAVGDQLLEIYEENEIPDYLLLANVVGNNVKIGVVVVPEVPERSRTSRAKVLSGSDINTIYIKGFNGFDLVKFIGNYVTIIVV